MAKSIQDVICDGWLTKSPPTKRIWRARWRRRWFLLTHSGELPGQYILTYYTDRNCRKLKGVIDLDHCEQVDLGLKLDQRKLKFDHVFDIKTPSRTYYLAADTEDEMKSWVNCICKICGLKPTNEDEDVHMPVNDVEIIEENAEDKQLNNYQNSTPLVASPVSKNPYIPISECITGKSPILDPKDISILIENNRRNCLFNKTELPSHLNDSYDLPHRNYINYDATQMNYVNDILDPRFYDCPRQLVPPGAKALSESVRQDKNYSPLQSPTDSDSVFNDDDWANTSASFNISKRASESSADMDLVATQKYTKDNSDKKLMPPPRPPKPSSTGHSSSYLNLTPTKISETPEEIELKSSLLNKESQCQKIITDDMYDFPRSHQVETENTKSTLGRRHNYNNAAPVNCSEGTIFRYDISPKPSTSTMVFKYDLDEKIDTEPASPTHSHCSSTPAYSNLPSPLLASETQVMPPPVVNRGLKPKRKLSDSHSINSNPEPPSPRNAPSVDRKLKPPTPLQEPHMRKSFNSCEEEPRKLRAAPSPTPPSLGRSHESVLEHYDNQEQVYHQLNSKMQYLDLDLDGSASSASNNQKTFPKNPEAHTGYMEVDFIKTQALNIARNIQENERQERVPYVKK